jgi:hypothetical protein
MPTVDLRLLDQVDMAPTPVADQSSDLTSSPVVPPPPKAAWSATARVPGRAELSLDGVTSASLLDLSARDRARVGNHAGFVRFSRTCLGQPRRQVRSVVGGRRGAEVEDKDRTDTVLRRNGARGEPAVTSELRASCERAAAGAGQQHSSKRWPSDLCVAHSYGLPYRPPSRNMRCSRACTSTST